MTKIKKLWVIVTAIFFLGFMSACSTGEEAQPDGLPAETEPTTLTFTGTIKEIHDQSALIVIGSGPILSAGDKVTVDLSVASKDSFEIGDQVRVGYDGSVRESYPLQIDTLTIEKMN